MLSRVGRKLKTIFCISDIHLEKYATAKEFYTPIEGKLPSADILILAGDVGYPHQPSYKELLTYFSAKYPRVLLVPGNHEYYPCNFDRKTTDAQLREICQETKVTLLDKSTEVIDDVTFHGTVLWSAIDSGAVKSLNDFNFVFRNRLDYLEQFMGCYTWLRESLKNSTTEHNVVITHHLPTKKLIHPKFLSYESLNTAFYTDILDNVEMKNVDLWFCGHTHEMMEAVYLDTKFFVNPVGYKGEKKVTELSDKIFEV